MNYSRTRIYRFSADPKIHPKSDIYEKISIVRNIGIENQPIYRRSTVHQFKVFMFEGELDEILNIFWKFLEKIWSMGF